MGHILWVPMPTFFWLSCNLVEILVLAWNTPPTQLSTHFASFFTLDHLPTRIKQVKKVLLFENIQTKVWNTSIYTKNIIFSTKQAWNISDNQFYLYLNDLCYQWTLMLLFYFIIPTIFEISWKFRISFTNEKHAYLYYYWTKYIHNNTNIATYYPQYIDIITGLL